MAQKGKSASGLRGIGVVGQSLNMTSSKDDDMDGSTPGMAWGSQPNSPKGFSMVDQVMAVNRSLVQQIDALRMRVQVDSRHHNDAKAQFEKATYEKLKEKDGELSELRGELREREAAVGKMKEENVRKRQEITSLQHTINALQEDVKASKTYVEDIQHSLNVMQVEKAKLETGDAYHEKDELISRLSTEVAELHANMARLEVEVVKAKEVVATQGGKLRMLEHDKHNIHVKFKDDLAKATQTMRHEVEKMREVMRGQWEEMRVLRKQNEGMRSDIKEIRDLLLGDAGNHGNNNNNNNNNSNMDKEGHVYNMGALKPSLPVLSASTRRFVANSKKKT